MGTTYNQLSMDERCEIYRLHADGKSRRAIARSLGRAPSTICRELVRNSGAKVGYKVEWAEIQARARRCRRLYKLQCSSTLRDLVLDGLAMGWSPEQIAGRLERENGRPVISHESIYRYVYWRVATHRDYLHRLLPRAKFQRGWRGRRGGSSARYIAGRIPISERPPEVADRRQLGHWEADLMLFSRYGQAVLVAHERHSRLLLVSRQPSKAAAPVADSLLAMLATFPAQQRRTITFDNGSEFSEHHRLTSQLGMPTYFCDPHSPWQKGGIENAIGRLRTLDPCRLDDLILDYNLTPRRCLDFRTPLEVFLGQEISLGVALEM
ncbi:MAG: Integrase catalytic [Rhodospirillaceae bacterium]|nr:MAG: Integrase catalytic [Rhodospirillaceae bacterium]